MYLLWTGSYRDRNAHVDISRIRPKLPGLRHEVVIQHDAHLSPAVVQRGVGRAVGKHRPPAAEVDVKHALLCGYRALLGGVVNPPGYSIVKRTVDR